MSAIQIKTKRIYEPASADDGFRLLIMRLWPRGVRKDAVSAWEKELGPSLELLKAFRSGAADWEQYRKRYLDEVSTKRQILDWVRAKASDGTVTLLCGCQDESHCHRTLLQGLVLKR